MNRIINFFDFILNKQTKTVLIISIISYILFWSIIVYEKLLALNQSVFDLSLFDQNLWSVIFQHGSLITYLLSIPNNSFKFVLFPLSLFGNYTLLLVFQTIMLAVSAIPLYLFSLEQLKNRYVSVLISISYLIYFPLSGVNWFTIHFQAFFIFLFICGVYLFIRGKFISGLIFLFFAGTIKYPFEVFLIVFSIIFLIDSYRPFSYFQKKEGVRKYRISLMILLIMMIALFVVGRFSVGDPVVSVTRTSNLFSLSSLSIKLYTILLIYGPFLFLPFFSKRWWVFNLALSMLIILSPNPNYYYPSLFKLQYSSSIIVFVFLGFIDALTNGKIIGLLQRKNKPYHEIVKKIVIISFMLILVGAVFFQPYGPLNDVTSDNFNLSQCTDYNITIFHEMQKMVSLIPKNDPYVLAQGNIVNIYPRVLPYNETVLSGGLYPNLTIQTNNGKWLLPRIDYVIVDPYNMVQFTYNYGGGKMMSMEQTFNLLLTKYKYGIYAEASGMTLLKKNYVGSPIYFSKLYLNIPIDSLWNGNNQYNGFNNTLKVNNSNYHLFFYKVIPYFLAPGTYNFNFSFKANNISNRNLMILNVVNYRNGYILATNNVTGILFTNQNNNSIQLEIHITIKKYEEIEFKSTIISWSGNLSLQKIIVLQTGV